MGNKLRHQHCDLKHPRDLELQNIQFQYFLPRECRYFLRNFKLSLGPKEVIFMASFNSHMVYLWLMYVLQALETRAQRFGLSMTETAKIQARAARFGTSASANGTSPTKPAKLSMETGVCVNILVFLSPIATLSQQEAIYCYNQYFYFFISWYC